MSVQPIPMRTGDESEINVQMTLQRLLKQGYVKAFRRTVKDSSDDRSGIDFYITVQSNGKRIEIPLQVKSTEEQMREHAAYPNQDIPAVNGQRDDIEAKIIEILESYNEKPEETPTLTLGQALQKRLEAEDLKISALAKKLDINSGYVSLFIRDKLTQGCKGYEALKAYATGQPATLKAPEKVPAQQSKSPSVKQVVSSLRDETQALEQEIASMQDELSKKRQQLAKKQGNLTRLVDAYNVIKQIVGGDL